MDPLQTNPAQFLGVLGISTSPFSHPRLQGVCLSPGCRPRSGRRPSPGHLRCAATGGREQRQRRSDCGGLDAGHRAGNGAHYGALGFEGRIFSGSYLFFPLVNPA